MVGDLPSGHVGETDDNVLGMRDDVTEGAIDGEVVGA
jgi:hypothetical protein